MSHYAPMDTNPQSEGLSSNPYREASRGTVLRKHAQVFIRDMSNRIRGATSASFKAFGNLGRVVNSSKKGSTKLRMNRWFSRVVQNYL
ncbi:hypothetical protein NPIL_329281 [Nephila pilipes]|uniref:Uncharacterized protein n=1 Tax=Nephila pilipes TaxID=299642 RepID=A0A8X6Q7W0_NEPPI|nr:hypothetical protein NPIL_329281 [Nephila pilipes]